MITYQQLVDYLQNQHEYPITLSPEEQVILEALLPSITIKSNYIVINVSGSDYHITIFVDQWDDYEEVSYKPYYLFHISSNGETDRCSSYFWVDKKTNRIKKIPRKYFNYNQPTYNFFSSTRSPCHLRDIEFLLKVFQRILLSAQT